MRGAMGDLGELALACGFMLSGLVCIYGWRTRGAEPRKESYSDAKRYSLARAKYARGSVGLIAGLGFLAVGVVILVGGLSR